MHLTILVQNESGTCINLDVTPDMTLGVVKSLVEHDVKIPIVNQKLFYNDRALTDDDKTLEAEGISDGDLLTVHEFVQNQWRRKSNKANNQAEALRLAALEDPAAMTKLRGLNSQLADAVNDEQKYHQIFNDLNAAVEREKEEKIRYYERLNDDPFDVEAQKKIEEIIRQEQIMKNMELALAENPEFFGRVHMLYIPVEVNGVQINAFVDSGAQATIMSPDCAEKCGILRLNDTRFAGEARGVGTAKILGRVHTAQIKIGKFFLKSSFTVMEGKDVDLLLGLDMLKRHQASIDLKKNVLRIEDDETPFLSEGELPKNAFGSKEPVVQGPGGLRVGGRSGALMGPQSGPEPEAGPSSAAPEQPLASQSGPESEAGPSSAGPQQQQPLQQQTSIPQKRTAGAGPSPQPQQRRASPTSRFPREHVEQLISHGYSEAEVIQALELAGGNLDMAFNILYG